VTTLYVSDLDGTLLDAHSALSPTTHAGLAALLARGVQFTVATARSIPAIRERIQLPLPVPVAASNGAFVCDLGSDAPPHRIASIDPGAAVTVAREAAELGLPLVIVTWTPDERQRLWFPADHNEGTAAYLRERRSAQDPRLQPVTDPRPPLERRVTGMWVIARAARIEALYERLAPTRQAGLRAYRADDHSLSGWRWLMMSGADANKGAAVRWLIETHAPEAERLVAFGDDTNDLTLFAEADYAVATANAVPQVKAAADEVIGPHHEDAVITWLLGNVPN